MTQLTSKTFLKLAQMEGLQRKSFRCLRLQSGFCVKQIQSQYGFKLLKQPTGMLECPLGKSKKYCIPQLISSPDNLTRTFPLKN